MVYRWAARSYARYIEKMSEPNPKDSNRPHGHSLWAVWGALVLFALAVMLMNG